MTKAETEPTQSTEEPDETSDQPDNYEISDFLIKSVGDDDHSLVNINEFFNNKQIKSEIHWFTHRDTLERAAQRDDRRLFYIAPGDRYLAGLMVWCESRVLASDEAQIRLIAVTPSHRNHGLGRSLVREAADFARSWNKSKLIADVAADSPAVAFWRSCGFDPREEYETDRGRRMYRMETPLN